jgi:hypothetical protein
MLLFYNKLIIFQYIGNTDLWGDYDVLLYEMVEHITPFLREISIAKQTPVSISIVI